MIMVPNPSLIAIAADVKTNVLDGGSLRLFQNDINPTIDSVVGDFTVATFSGYANLAVATWSAPFLDADGSITSLGTLANFIHNGGGTSNLIYGAYYLDAGGDLVWAERFDTAPIGMASSGNAIAFVPRFQYNRAAA